MPGSSAANTAPAPVAVSELGRSAARGAATMIFGQVVRVVIQFGGVFVLARVLSPEHYGAFAMVTAVVSLGEQLQDFGLSTATIQAPTVTHAQQSNLFWINTGIGLSLSVLVFAGAPALARFYEHPELVPIARALSPTFLINGVACQFRAHLTRGFRMGVLSLAVLCAQAAGIAAAVWGALHGLGTWALVAQQLVFHCVNLAVMVKGADFWPGLPTRHTDTRSFVRFGNNLMGANLLSYLSRNANTVIIGNRFGVELAGLYDRAFMLLMLPLNQINTPVNTVALPTLSKLQHDPKRFERFLLHGQTVLLHVLFAIFSYAAAVGDVLVEVVLGDQWTSAGPLFRILTVAGVFQAAALPTYWAFTAKGLTHQNLRFSACARTGLLLVLFAGLPWGMQGVTVAYSLGLMLMWPVGLYWLSRTSDAPAWAVARNTSRCLAAYAVCGLCAYAGARGVATYAAYLQIGASALAMLVGVTALYVVWPAYRADLHAIANTRTLLRSAKTTTPL